MTSRSGTAHELAEQVKALALAVGFDGVGVSKALPTPETRFLRQWVERGYAGEMHYLVRRLEERVDPRRVLPGARSVVSVALRYGDAASGSPPSAPGPPSAGPEVARYARGEDYHEVMGERLRALEAAIAAYLDAPVAMRSYVDTGPVQERAHAAAGGLGWIGKNTCLIHPREGSYFFLGALLCDLELEADDPEPDHCGSCRACLDACPTDAFVDPYVLDARRCIAYTTIEDPAPIPLELREGQGDRVFGCDICQEVCPWNRPERLLASGRPDPLGLHERLRPAGPWLNPTLEWILRLDEASWRLATRKSAMRRSGYRGLIRNALVVAGNSGDSSLQPVVARHAAGPDPLLAEHAEWALARLRPKPSPGDRGRAPGSR